MNNNRITNILLCLAAAIFIFGLGYKWGEYKNNFSPSSNSNFPSFNKSNQLNGLPKEFDTQLFMNTWNEIESKYVDQKKVDRQKMFYGALKGMVGSVEDPYTFFLTPEENKESKSDLEGKFEGIGAQLGLKDNQITVVSPMKNSPAEKAGVRSGDVIIKVDKVSTTGWTLQQAVSKIRGPKGTAVTLGLLRKEKELEISIQRDQIFVPLVELKNEVDSFTRLNII